MKKIVIILSVLAFVACNKSAKTEDQVGESSTMENDVRQRTIDSMSEVNGEKHHNEVKTSETHHSSSTSTSSSPSNDNGTVNETKTTPEPAKRKGMSNTTKGALIGTGVGIVGGAATGAATSEDKGKGAVTGGLIGGAVGSGVGYGIGAKKDKEIRESGK